MESTLLTSPAAFSSFAASKLPSCNLFSSARSSYVEQPSQLARLRVKTTCHREVRGLNRFGSGSQPMSFGTGYSHPVRKNPVSASSSVGNCGSGDGATENPTVVAEAGEDVIILNVSGMMCEGCAGSVKRILESQPQVSSASVELTTETALVSAVSEAKAISNWQQQLGEALAKHLTTCGFESSVRGEAAIKGGSPS